MPAVFFIAKQVAQANGDTCVHVCGVAWSDTRGDSAEEVMFHMI
jgi:hypothetical protein